MAYPSGFSQLVRAARDCKGPPPLDSVRRNMGYREDRIFLGDLEAQRAAAATASSARLADQKAALDLLAILADWHARWGIDDFEEYT